MALKTLSGGMRYAGKHGYDCGKGWHESPRKHHDEAMKTARESVAQGEIKPEDFEIIKKGLRASEPTPEDSYRRSDSAFKTARMRFAKGEISLEEFETLRKALS